MSLNFFKAGCSEPPLTASEFGLCDDEIGEKAYTNIDAPTIWIATVKNSSGKPIVFTAIDYCIIKSNEYAGRARCDGMLTFTNHIYFVELKNEAKNWIPRAIEQLESTIKFFKDTHGFQNYRFKKAFACNRKHRRFQEIDNEDNLSFYRKYGFRLDIQAEIIVV